MKPGGYYRSTVNRQLDSILRILMQRKHHARSTVLHASHVKIQEINGLRATQLSSLEFICTVSTFQDNS